MLHENEAMEGDLSIWLHYTTAFSKNLNKRPVYF